MMPPPSAGAGTSWATLSLHGLAADTDRLSCRGTATAVPRHESLSVSAASPCSDNVAQDVPAPADGGGIMTDTPQLLLAHHLKALKLPTFLREYDKLARQCAAEGLDYIRFL